MEGPGAAEGIGKRKGIEIRLERCIATDTLAAWPQCLGVGSVLGFNPW